MITKDELQRQSVEVIKKNNGHGIIQWATGVGKSKVVIDYITDSMPFPILWVTPTTKLRDKTIKEEFTKWGVEDIYENHVTTICYRSLHLVKNTNYGLIVLDEGHNITSKSAVFFQQNSFSKILLLTATLPRDIEKVDIIRKLRLAVILKMTTDEAVAGEFVAPYEINVINCQLSTVKDVKVKAGFMTSEVDSYMYYSTALLHSPNSFPLRLTRMHVIYKAKQKLEVTMRLLKKIPNNKRVIIFCPSIEFANKVCLWRYHSKTDNTHYQLFNEKQVNRLSVVNSLNEGDNLVDVDIAIIMQVNSNEKNYLQRQGRILRWRNQHQALLYVLQYQSTVDEQWTNMSLQSLNQNNIKYYDEKSI